MSEQQTISQADISGIEGALAGIAGAVAVLHQTVETVDGKVEQVAADVSATQSQLGQLAEEFSAFVKADAMAKELQLAETRLVKVRQELEKTFGYHEEVRRHTSGILQAADLSIVRQETIKIAAEELMLKAPRYWLAPGLIALSAWLNDNRSLAERAMMEAVRRDDNKASLYFALIARRGERRQASGAWLQRFFSLQEPANLDRELVVLINAVANGIFGPEGRGFCATQFEMWLKELSQRVGFVEEQRNQWSQALKSKEPSLGTDEYPYLRKYSPTWPQLDESLRGACIHRELKAFFEGIFEGEIVVPSLFSDAVDEMLDKLVTDFDDDELPLRRDERLLTLIVEEGGDKTAAQRRFGTEKDALEEHLSFTQLITNAAMHPDISGATKMTQRFATALSRDWICEAHDDLTAKNRTGVPTEILINIDSWDGKTRDGENESDLVSSIQSHLSMEEAKHIVALVLNPINWIALGIGSLLAIIGLINMQVFLIIIGLAGIGWFVYSKWQLGQQKLQVQKHYSDLQDTFPKVLKAVLAEVVDWRADFAGSDAEAAELRTFLQSISSDQHVLTSFESGRAVMPN